MADIRAVLAERVAMCASMRAAAQASFKTAEEAVTKALAELPKDTRNARQEYNGSDAKLRSLEHAHSIAARLTNEQERNMLKDMEKCKKRKKELFKLIAFEDALKDAKAAKDSARKKLDDAYALENELSLALKKLELATLLNCKAMDLVDAVVAVPSEAARSRLLSRKRAVEASCQVAIDVMGKGTKLAAKVWGLPSGVAAAVWQLEKLAAMVSEEMLGVPPPVLVWLAAHRAAVAAALESKHDVKVDVRLPGKAGTTTNSALVPSQVKKAPQAAAETGRASNNNQSSSSSNSSSRSSGGSSHGLGSVTITGLPAAVAACVAEVKSIKATTKTISLPSSAVRAAIVGSKGSGVQALEKEHQCIVEVDASPSSGGDEKNGTNSNKSSNTNGAAAAAAAAASNSAPVGSVARVTGLAGNVGTCCAALQEIVRMNEPIEEVVPLEVSFGSSTSTEATAAFAASWLLSSRAARVVAVQQRTGCSISLDRLRAKVANVSPPSQNAAASTAAQPANHQPSSGGGKKPTSHEAGAAAASSLSVPPCVVSGTRAQVAAGVGLIRQLLGTLARDTVLVDLGEGSLGAVFGKGGSAIQALRVAHPWCLIDVDPKHNVARIAALADEVSAELANLPRDHASSHHSQHHDTSSDLPAANQESVEAILACAAAVQALADANQRKVVDLEPSLHRQFWGAPGRSARAAIGAIGGGDKQEGEGSSSSGKGTVVLEKPAGAEKGVYGVALRGPKAGLEGAAQMVHAFQANHVEERLALLCDEDEKCLLAGNDYCLLRQVQQSCHVDVSLERPTTSTMNTTDAAEKSRADDTEGTTAVATAASVSADPEATAAAAAAGAGNQKSAGKGKNANKGGKSGIGKEKEGGSGDAKSGKGKAAGGGRKANNASAHSSGVVATVLLAGQSEAVAKAKSLILSELNGSSDGKVVCVSVASDDLIGYAIGKQGANLKRLESTYGIHAEAVSSRLLVRLKGKDAAKVAAAAADLEAILDAVPTTASLALRPPQLGSFLTAAAVDAVGAECGVSECEIVGVTGAVEGFPAVVSVALKGKSTALRAASQVLHSLASDPPSATVVFVLDQAQASAALRTASSDLASTTTTSTSTAGGNSSSGGASGNSGVGKGGNNVNNNGRRRGKGHGKGGKGGQKGSDDNGSSSSSHSSSSSGAGKSKKSESLVSALASLGRGVSAAHKRLPCTIEVLPLSSPSSSSSKPSSAAGAPAAAAAPEARAESEAAEGALVSLEGHPTCVAAARPLVVATLNHFFPDCFLTVDLPRWPRAGSPPTNNTTTTSERVSSDEFKVSFGSIAADDDDMDSADATDPAFELHFKELNALAGREALSAVAASATASSSSSSSGGSASEALQLSLDARDGGRVTVCAGSASVAAAAVAELQRRWGVWARGKACLPLLSNQVGTVVGSKGANLRALKANHPGLKRLDVDRGYVALGEDEAGAPSKDGAMTSYSSTMTPSSSRPRLLLEGSQAAVAAAGLAVQEQLDKEAASRAAAMAERAKNKVHVVEVLVNDPDALPVLIGRKGSEIKRIESLAECNIQLLGPHSGNNSSRAPPPSQDDGDQKGNANKGGSSKAYDRASGRDRAVVRGTGTSAKAGAALVREVLAKFEAEKAARAMAAHSASLQQGGEEGDEGVVGEDNTSSGGAGTGSTTGVVDSSSGNDSSSCGWSDARKEALLAASPPPMPPQAQQKPKPQPTANSKPLQAKGRKEPQKSVTPAVAKDSKLPTSTAADSAPPPPTPLAPVGPASAQPLPQQAPPSSLDQAYLFDQFGASGSARLLGMLAMPHSMSLEQQEQQQPSHHPFLAAGNEADSGSQVGPIDVSAPANNLLSGTSVNSGDAQTGEPAKKKNEKRKKGKHNKKGEESNSNGHGHAEEPESSSRDPVEASSVTFGWGADATTPITTDIPEWSSHDAPPKGVGWGEIKKEGAAAAADNDDDQVVEVTFGSLSDNGWDLPPASVPDSPSISAQQLQEPPPLPLPGLDQSSGELSAAKQQPPSSRHAAKSQKKKKQTRAPSDPGNPSSHSALPAPPLTPQPASPAPPSAESIAQAALLEQFGAGDSARLMGLLFENPKTNKKTNAAAAPAPAPSFFSISAPAAEP